MRNLYAYFAEIKPKKYVLKTDSNKKMSGKAWGIGYYHFSRETMMAYADYIMGEIKDHCSLNISIIKATDVTIEDIYEYNADEGIIDEVIKYAQLCNSINYRYNIRKRNGEKA